MKESIKFKGTQESFINYLKTHELINEKKFSVKKEELEKFFEIKSKEELINVSLLSFKDFYRCKIFSEIFIFYHETKKIKVHKLDGEEKSVEFQRPIDEGNYLKYRKKNPNAYDIFIEVDKGKWQNSKDLGKFNDSIISKRNYFIVEKPNIELNNIIGFTPFYEDYIYISNKKVYKEFEFKKSESRNKLFDDLDDFLTYNEKEFFPICGYSGSGKTTSILYYISKKRGDYNIFYINCYTVLRKDLNNNTIKDILQYELSNSVKEDERLAEKFKSYIYTLFKKDVERNTEFLWKLIDDIKDIYNKEEEIEEKKLTIIIDQYSSKHDQGNHNIYKLINESTDAKSKFQIILISSMNNTCVNNNLKKSLENSMCPIIDDIFINYSMYGQLFEISDVIIKEENELKKIINQEFGNSGLIYYDLKSKLLDCDEKQKNSIISNYVINEKKNIKKEILLFYKIIDSNNEKDKKSQKNNVYKILEVLDIMKKKHFYNFKDIPDLLEQLPMKYFKILYNEIDISHPEFVKLLPKKIKEKISSLKDSEELQKENMESPLKDTLGNNIKDLNEFLIQFDGNSRRTISFFSFEPLYQIIEIILKEIIFYYNFQEKILNEVYSELVGGIRGDFFEYIFINFIKIEKRFSNVDFEIIENINSIVPYHFSINKFSHRLLLLKKNNYENTDEEIDKMDDEEYGCLYEEESQEDDYDEKESDIQEKRKAKPSKEKKVNYKKKCYSKSKDKEIFAKLKMYINKTFNTNQLKTEINLPSKNIYLNQVNSNAKYVDGGLLIYLNEKNHKLNFKLIVFQVSIKRDKNKIFNKNETSLILAYIKEHLENCYPNINIEEIVFCYIIDSEQQDIIIKTNCNNYSIGCYGFNINSKKITKVNELTFYLNKFSKFNSCFILKSNTNVDEKFIESIDKEEPTLFVDVKKELLSNYFEPFFERDISIANDFYIYNNLIIDFGIYEHLTNYALLVSIDEKEKKVEYIVLNEKKALDYSSHEIKNIKDIKKDDSKLRLITFLIPMKLKKKYIK